MMTRVTLKSVFGTNKSPFCISTYIRHIRTDNKSPFCIQLMIMYVFQHKSEIFGLIDVTNVVILFFQTNILLSLI